MNATAASQILYVGPPSLTTQLAGPVCELGLRFDIFPSVYAAIERIAASTVASCLLIGGDTAAESIQTAATVLDRHSMKAPMILLSREPVSALNLPAEAFGRLSVVSTPSEIQAMLQQAIRSITESELTDPFVGSRQRMEQLSPRERSIIHQAANGVPNKRIASALGLSIKTVERYRRNAYRKLAVASTAEMTRVVVLAELAGVAQLRDGVSMNDAIFPSADQQENPAGS
ncbi:MAG: LuxR C-terminal-related transcriptional regulator [Planctomycetota bacterium]